MTKIQNSKRFDHLNLDIVSDFDIPRLIGGPADEAWGFPCLPAGTGIFLNVEFVCDLVFDI